MRLRVVHIVQTDSFAGVERYVANLASEQAKRGHSVRVIGGRPEAMRQAVGDQRVMLRPARSLMKAIGAIDSWRDCDILHAHMTAAEVATLLAIRAGRVPLVSTRHFAQNRGASPLGRLAAPWAARRVDRQVSVSRFVADHIDGESTVVLPGVPSLKDAPGAAERDRSVLIAQRLEEEKETSLGLRAFSASGLADAGWRLDLAGEGALRGSLENLAQSLGISGSVRFLGRRSDLPQLMQRSGILLATCPHEHFGLTVVEAMAAGLPVVAAGSAGHRETVGLASEPSLFPPGDVPKAAQLLGRLANHPDWRDRYAHELQALQRELFTLEAQARSIDEVYRSVL